MNPKVQIVLDYMNANPNQRLPLAKLAEMANLSTFHLCHLFKSQTGLSPEQYSRSLRMEKARHLLTTTLFSIKQIMAMAGYNDKSHFARHFRKAFGLTPSEYRKQFLDLILVEDCLKRRDRKIG